MRRIDLIHPSALVVALAETVVGLCAEARSQRGLDSRKHASAEVHLLDGAVDDVVIVSVTYYYSRMLGGYTYVITASDDGDGICSTGWNISECGTRSRRVARRFAERIINTLADQTLTEDEEV